MPIKVITVIPVNFKNGDFSVMVVTSDISRVDLSRVKQAIKKARLLSNLLIFNFFLSL